MPEPLSLKPLNNHALVEIQREYTEVVRYNKDEVLQRGTVINVNFSNYHITGMGGMRILESDAEYKALTAELDSLVGCTVMWSEGTEAGTIFKHEGKEYALIPFWRLIGFEPKERVTADDGAESAEEVVAANSRGSK